MTTRADTEAKIAALEAALAAEPAPEQLFDLAQSARLALELRGTDEMIGLEPVPEDRLLQLEALADRALHGAVQGGHAPAYADFVSWALGACEHEAGFATLLPLAEGGDADAAIWAAHLAYFARHHERQLEAFVLARRGAKATSLPADKAGHSDYLLGLFHTTSYGCDEDLVAARRHHLAAADQGHVDALFELYVFHAKGMGCEADLPKAIGFVERAAEAGQARAMFSLAAHLASGNEIEADPGKALQWYERAAEAGHGRAAATAGIMLALGQEVAADESRAAALFQQAEALGFPWWDLADACGVDVETFE